MNLVEDGNLTYADTKWGKLWLHSKDLIGMTILGGNYWDGDLLLPVFDECADPNGIAIDVGAYIGLNARYLANKYKHVYAFEPNKPIYKLLEANTDSIENIIPVDAALYDRSRVILIPNQSLDYSNIGNYGGLGYVPSNRYDEDGNSPDVFTLDKFFGVKDSSDKIRVKLIKIDAQGCDPSVIAGARELIARDKPTIIWESERELEKYHTFTTDYAIGWLSEAGYQVEESKTHKNNYICRYKS